LRAVTWTSGAWRQECCCCWDCWHLPQAPHQWELQGHQLLLRLYPVLLLSHHLPPLTCWQHLLRRVQGGGVRQVAPGGGALAGLLAPCRGESPALLPAWLPSCCYFAALDGFSVATSVYGRTCSCFLL